MQIPHYLTLDEARQVLAEFNVHLNARQVRRSAEPDHRGKRRLPWFIDPIDGRLRIEKSALLSTYFNRQREAESDL